MVVDWRLADALDDRKIVPVPHWHRSTLGLVFVHFVPPALFLCYSTPVNWLKIFCIFLWYFAAKKNGHLFGLLFT